MKRYDYDRYWRDYWRRLYKPSLVKRWLRAFTALLALGLVLHMQIFFALIWRDGSLVLHEPNRSILVGEQVLYFVLALYCLYRLADIFRTKG